jgi:hypothetical protein
VVLHLLGLRVSIVGPAVAVIAAALAQQPPSTAAISGTVTDGVTGRPVGAVIVALRAPSTGAPLARIVRVVTDEQGRFVLRDLPAGEGYTVVTTRLGYVDGAYGQQTMFGASGRINLKDGEWFPRANIVMWRPGAISGTLRDEANEPVVGAYVRVLARHVFGGQPQLLAGPTARTDDRGEYRIAGLGPGQYVVHVPSIQSSVPVDAPAGLMGANGDAVRGQGALSFSLPPRTDAVLDPLGSSQQVIGNFVTPPPPTRGRANAYAMTFYPGVDKADLASPVDLALGEERTGIDLTIRPVSSVSVSGTVAGPNEAMAGLVLRLVPVALEGLSDGAEAATVLVGADRTFTFFNVPAGDYVVDAPGTSLELTYTGGVEGRMLPQSPGLRWSGFQSGSLESGPPGTGYIRKSGSRNDRFWTRTAVSVGEADINNLIVTMTPSFVLKGSLVYEGTTRTTVESTPVTMVAGGGSRPGTTTTTTEVTPRPSTQPTIELEPAAGNPGLGIPRSDRPEDGDPQDNFTIAGLKPGEYVLRMAQGASKFTVKSITIDGVDYTTKPIDSSILGPKTEAVVTLTDKLTSVRGSVHDSRGPVTNAAVLVFPAERNMWKGYGLRPARLRAAPLSGSSSFVIDGLPAGEYLAIAVPAQQVSAWQDTKFLERAAALATRFTLQWGESRSLDLSLAVIR